MKEYTVEVEIRAWAEVSVVARNGEEAVEAACDMVDLDDGTVAEEGSPKDLEEKNGVYAHMVKLQTESQNWKLA